MTTLLLEDDLDLGQAVVAHLEDGGHAVHWCKLLGQAEAYAGFDLALLDLGLPDGDSLALLSRWRDAGRRTPVIVLSARDQVSDRVRGLQAGADDYLVKPFDLDELMARIEAVRRRTDPPDRLRLGRAVLDVEAHVASGPDGPVELTAMEWTVLAQLARQPGRVVSRRSIEDELARQGRSLADSNSIEVVVSRLRKKLGADLISTRRGLGYRLNP